MGFALVARSVIIKSEMYGNGFFLGDSESLVNSVMTDKHKIV